MESVRTPWLRWTLVLCLLLLAATAQAAVRVAGAPPGWDVEPSPDATARAARWAEQLDGRVTEVFSTRADDEFSETLAVLTVPGAMPEGADLDPEAALLDAVGPLFDSTPETPRFLESTTDAPIVTGIWDEGKLTYDVAVVSAGPNRAAVILAVRSSERSLYAQVFDEVVAGITGAAPPVVPFDIRTWRVSSGIGWLLALGFGWIVMATTRRGEDGAAAVGRGVAAGLILLALVAAGVTYVYLAEAAAALRLAGISRFTVATEVAAGGVLGALLAWFIGALRDSTVRRVESAPTGGTFSSTTAHTLTKNLVPPTRPASLTDPGHGMDPEALDAADEAAMKARKREPRPTLVGAPSLAAGGGDQTFDEIWAKAQAAAEGEGDVSDMPTTEMDRPNFEVPEEVKNAPRVEPKASSGTIVGPAPGPESREPPRRPRRKPKTKTEVLQFPPPMSENED